MTLKMKWVALKLGLLMGSAQALEVSVEVQNLTHGIYFTPLLITAHDSDSQLFQLGQAASAELQAMAEGGDISGLVTQLESAGGNITANPAEGLLAPGAMTPTVSFSTEGSDNTHLSLVAMMLPTNDGFVGLDSWKLPESAGTYTVYLNAYDAGTEANDEGAKWADIAGGWRNRPQACNHAGDNAQYARFAMLYPFTGHPGQ